MSWYSEASVEDSISFLVIVRLTPAATNAGRVDGFVEVDLGTEPRPPRYQVFHECTRLLESHSKGVAMSTTQVYSAEAQALFGSDAVAHVWTTNEDGTSQVSVVWFIARGDEILFGTDGNSYKARNLRRDDRVVLSIEDVERNERGFQRHLVIRGRASIEAAPDSTLMDELAFKYTGLRQHPLVLRDSPTSVVVRVAIDRISGEGPWLESPR